MQRKWRKMTFYKILIDWKPLNAGCRADFRPDPYPEYGHDPHCVKIHPLDPNILYQQNHCGIYRMERSAGTWVRIGESMPKKIGDIGFPTRCALIPTSSAKSKLTARHSAKCLPTSTGATRAFASA